MADVLAYLLNLAMMLESRRKRGLSAENAKKRTKVSSRTLQGAVQNRLTTGNDREVIDGEGLFQLPA
jgi:hypothetical protein